MNTPIAQQKKILAMLDEGYTYEQIMKELGVHSTMIARVKNRRQAYRDGLVDTQYVGQPMNTSGQTYEPRGQELLDRIAIVRARHIESGAEETAPGIRIVKLKDLGLNWVGGDRV